MIDVERLPVEALLAFFLAFLSSQLISILYRSSQLPYLIALVIRGILMIAFLLSAAYFKKNSPSELTIISALIFVALWI